MILSNYFQYLKFGGSRSIQNYLNGENDGRVPSVSARFWHYHRLIEMYQKSFGAKNVLVLPFEMLAQDSAGFVRTICNFAGVEVLDEVLATTKLNARSEYFSYAALRFLSPLIRSSRGNGFALSLFGRKAGKKIHLGLRRIVGSIVPYRLNDMTKRSLMRKLELALDNSLEHSNRVVEMSTGLDLARYGYAVAMASPAQDGN